LGTEVLNAGDTRRGADGGGGRGLRAGVGAEGAKYRTAQRGGRESWSGTSRGLEGGETGIQRSGRTVRGAGQMEVGVIIRVQEGSVGD